MPVHCDSHSTFLFIPEAMNTECAPQVRGSACVLPDLSVKVYLKSVCLPMSSYDHVLVKKGYISSMSELTNLLAYVKSLTDESSTEVSKYFKVAHELLLRYLEEDVHGEHNDFVYFVTEQMRLLQISNHARQYSPGTIVKAFLWHMTSHSLYVKVR